MGRIEEKFRELREKNKAALICYVTAGDPDIDFTEQIIDCMEASGVDMVEIGIPFSDPMADGPVIQAASERALAHSTSLSDVLSLVRRIRSRSDIPIILFGYYNPFFSYGTERFAREAREAGADGVLVVDLPPEEAGELGVHAEREGLDCIFLLAPTSTEERIEKVSQTPRGLSTWFRSPGSRAPARTWTMILRTSWRESSVARSFPSGGVRGVFGAPGSRDSIFFRRCYRRKRPCENNRERRGEKAGSAGENFKLHGGT